jgi:shikimate dehydrogenase
VIIRGSTAVCASLGYPNKQSVAPAMHNAGYQALALDFLFLALEVEPALLGQAVAGARALGFRGCSVTKPFKEAVIPLLDHLDGTAAAIGAGQHGPQRKRGTVRLQFRLDRSRARHRGGGGRRGRRPEFRGSSRARIPFRAAGLHRRRGRCGEGHRLGPQAGGLHGGPVQPGHPKRQRRGGSLRRRVRGRIRGNSRRRPLRCLRERHLRRHGRRRRSLPDPPSALRAGNVVLDAVIRPRNTALLRAARAARCRAVPGARMLLYQGLFQFRLFTGVEPPRPP